MGNQMIEFETCYSDVAGKLILRTLVSNLEKE